MPCQTRTLSISYSCRIWIVSSIDISYINTDCILYSSIYRGLYSLIKLIIFYVIFSVIYVSLKHVISTSPTPSHKPKIRKTDFVNSARVNSIPWIVLPSWTVPPWTVELQIKISSNLLQSSKPSKFFLKVPALLRFYFLGDLQPPFFYIPTSLMAWDKLWWNIWAKML